MEMNKLTDAKEYLEKALEIEQRTSNDLLLTTMWLLLSMPLVNGC